MSLSNDTRSIINPSNESVTYIDWVKLSEFFNQRSLAMKILYILITISIILGNAFVLLTTWRERRLHQPNKYFIACLAVADLFAGMFIAPVSLYFSSMDYETVRSMSVHLCRFFVWIDILVLTASIYTMAFISFDRYLKVSKPLQYKSRMTTSKSLKIIFTIWLISIALATYAATPNSGSRGILVALDTCLLSDINKRKGFYTFLFAFVFFLPSAVIMVMYSFIFVVAHKRHKMLRNGELGETCSNLQSQRSVLRRDLKIIRMLLVVVGVFIFCWFPTVISILVFFYRASGVFWNKSFSYTVSFSIIAVVAQLLPLMNSLCNPLIYACMDQTYREAFKRLLQRMMCRTTSIRHQQQQRQQQQQQQQQPNVVQ